MTLERLEGDFHKAQQNRLPYIREAGGSNLGIRAGYTHSDYSYFSQLIWANTWLVPSVRPQPLPSCPFKITVYCHPLIPFKR